MDSGSEDENDGMVVVKGTSQSIFVAVSDEKEIFSVV